MKLLDSRLDRNRETSKKYSVGCLPHDTRYTVFPPTNLHSPPLPYEKKKCNSTGYRCAGNPIQNIIFQGWPLLSGFSRAFLQRQRISRVSRGLPVFPGFAGHPVHQIQPSMFLTFKHFQCNNTTNKAIVMQEKGCSCFVRQLKGVHSIFLLV